MEVSAQVFVYQHKILYLVLTLKILKTNPAKNVAFSAPHDTVVGHDFSSYDNNTAE